MGKAGKKEIARAILQAEIISDRDGESVGKTLYDFGESIKKIDPSKLPIALEFGKLSARIMHGEKEGKVYKEYLDPEILTFISQAAQRGVKKGEIIEKYLPIKKLADDTKRKIKTKLIIPAIITFLVILLMYYILKDFITLMEDGSVDGNFDFPLFVGHNYFFITFGIYSLVVIPLVFFPHRVPKIKNMFTKIDSLMAVLFISILNRIGDSPVQIISFLKRVFKLGNIRTRKNDMDDLAKLLYKAKYIDYFQASRIMTVRNIPKDFPELLDEIMEDIRSDIEMSSSIIEEAVGTLSTILLIIPLAPTLYVIGSVLGALFEQAIQAM